jgi:hypothetical protein
MAFVPESVRLTEAGRTQPYDWSLTEDLSWTGTFRGNIGRLLVPASPEAAFTTDLASVPRVLTWLFPRYGMYTKAAVLHDYLCQTIGRETVEVFPAPSDEAGDDAGDDAAADRSEPQLIELRDRSDADEVFRLTMTELGVPWARRWLMWSAVSWATLYTSLWPGRASNPVLRWAGRVIAVAGAAAAVAIGVVAMSVVAWVVATLVLGAGAMLAGYVALGRWERGPVYLVAFGMTLASVPLIAMAVVIGILLIGYLLFEDVFSGFSRTRGRLRRLVSKPPPAAATPRQQRIEAVRES